MSVQFQIQNRHDTNSVCRWSEKDRKKTDTHLFQVKSDVGVKKGPVKELHQSSSIHVHWRLLFKNKRKIKFYTHQNYDKQVKKLHQSSSTYVQRHLLFLN